MLIIIIPINIYMVFSNTLYSGITTSGKEAFGTFEKKINAGEYIQNKSVNNMFCKVKLCEKPKILMTNRNLLLLKKYYSLQKPSFSIKNDVNSGLVTTIDLNNQNVIENNSGTTPTTLDVTSEPYREYVIDASGSLFGNTICGINNIENFRIPN